MANVSSYEVAQWKAWQQTYGMPEERADLRAALISRFAGVPHKLDPQELMAGEWWGPLQREREAKARRTRKKQSVKSMQAIFGLAIQLQNG